MSKRREEPNQTGPVVLLTGALVVALLSGRILEPVVGSALWWPAAAVVTLFLVRRVSLVVTVPLVAVSHLVADLVASGGDVGRFGQALVTASCVAGAYGIGAWLLRRGQQRHAPGSATEMLWFVLGLVVLAPAVNAMVSRAAFIAFGWIPRTQLWTGSFAMAVAEAAAVAGLVPFVVAMSRRGFRDSTTQARWATALLAIVGAVAGREVLGVAVGGQTLVFVAAIPMVVAAVVFGRASAVTVTAVTGVGIALGLGDVDPSAQLGIQSGYAAMAALVAILGAMRQEAVDHDQAFGVHAEQPTLLSSLDDSVPGLDVYRAALARGTRLLRVGVVVILAIGAIGSVMTDSGEAAEVWTRFFLFAPMPLALNALSHWWDRTRGHDAWRERLEVCLDALLLATLMLAYTADDPTREPLLTVLFIATESALRLPSRWALAVTGLFTSFAVLLQSGAFGSLFARPPSWTAYDSVGMIAVVLLFAAGLASAIARLMALHVAGLDAARRLDEIGVTVERQRAELEREHQEAQLATIELRRTVKELDAANRALETSRGGLERFASVVAHDLKSPISTSIAMAETIADVDMPAEQLRLLAGRIAPSLRRAVALMDRLHAHARATTTELSPEPVDLNDLVRTVLDDHSGRISSVGATVTQPTLLPRIECDPLLVSQALGNLLGNALRYAATEANPHPTIEVTGSWNEDGFTLTVADDGPGIDPARADDLFDLGARGRRGVEGIGLGLATAREVAERHDGRMWAHTSHLGGAAFSITLPAATPANRILLVEDDEAMRALYRLALVSGAQQVDVDEVATVSEALTLLDLREYDAVLLDLGLRDGHGLPVLDRCMEVGIPLHVITSQSEDAAVYAEARRRGARISDKGVLVRGSDVLVDVLVGASVPPVRT